MSKNNFVQLEKTLAECTSCYEKVAENLDREIERRDGQRREAIQKAENAVRAMKRILSIVFLALCGVVLFSVYKILFGA